MTTNTSATPGYRKLASGAIVEVDAWGAASFLTCSWLVQVPNGNPEPDSIADCYDTVECGAKVRIDPRFAGDPRVRHLLDATVCDHGHDRQTCEISLSPGGAAFEEDAAYRANVERYGPAWELEQADLRWVA